jgi:hypothetical protein
VCNSQGKSKLNVICNVSILVSLDLAWLNHCFRASAYTNTKGPGKAVMKKVHRFAFLLRRNPNQVMEPWKE